MQRDESDEVDEVLGEALRREVEHDYGDEASGQHQNSGEETAVRFV